MRESRYREARKRLGMKVEYAAVELGVSVTTLYSYERERTVPDAEVLRAMARLYNVSSDWLIGRDGLGDE